MKPSIDPSGPVLTVQDVTKIYRNQRGITSLSLQLERGEIYGLIGPNGAGKTTLFKAIAGLLPLQKGEIRIDGYSVRTHEEEAKQRLGSLIEAPALFEDYSAYRNLLIHTRFYRDSVTNPSAHIEELLEDVGLGHVRNEKAAGFSQGMKQRLGVALALVGRPSLLMLDEPMNGLDVDGILQFRNLIRYLRDKLQLTVLVSSHQLSELESLCDRVGILHGGRIKSEAPILQLEAQGMKLEEWYLSQIHNERMLNHG